MENNNSIEVAGTKEDIGAKDFYTIDVKHVIKSLLKRAWFIVISTVIAGIIGSLVYVCVAPTYASTIMFYVNNSSNSQNNPNFSINSSEITAAQALVRTYSVILENRQTLEKIIEETEKIVEERQIEDLEIDLTYKDLLNMIEASAADNTEIMKVTVSSNDPDEAAIIIEAISKVLPEKIGEVIDGASVKKVGGEIERYQSEKVAPSLTKCVLIAVVVGLFASAGTVVVFALLDGTVHDEEYVLQHYDCPVLAKIPDLMDSGTKHYGYYYQSNKTEMND